MFKNNKYTIIYFKIIEKAKNELRMKGKEIYFESHHIIPKCMGGFNKKDNLVLLTAKEHFICHHLLIYMVEKYTNEYYLMLAAISYFTGNNKKVKRNISARQYSLLSKIKSEVQINRRKDKDFNDKVNKKQSETKKLMFKNGNIKPRKDWNMSDEQKELVRENMSEYWSNEENKKIKSEQVKEYWKNNPHPILGKTGELAPTFGKKWSEETKNLQKQKALKRIKLVCEFCDKACDPGNHYRHHGKNCKKAIDIEKTQE